MRYLLILVILTFSGCQGALPLTPEDYSSLIAVHFALSSLDASDEPSEPEDETHAREDCPTGGWVGDAAGVRIRCGACRPSYYESDETDPIPVPPSTIPSETAPKPRVGAVVNEPFDRFSPAPVVDDPDHEQPKQDPKPVAKPATQGNNRVYSAPRNRVLPRLFRRGSGS